MNAFKTPPATVEFVRDCRKAVGQTVGASRSCGASNACVVGRGLDLALTSRAQRGKRVESVCGSRRAPDRGVGVRCWCGQMQGSRCVCGRP